MTSPVLCIDWNETPACCFRALGGAGDVCVVLGRGESTHPHCHVHLWRGVCRPTKACQQILQDGIAKTEAQDIHRMTCAQRGSTDQSRRGEQRKGEERRGEERRREKRLCLFPLVAISACKYCGAVVVSCSVSLGQHYYVHLLLDRFDFCINECTL